MRILISGASIAGPVLAYWLARGGFGEDGRPGRSRPHAHLLFRLDQPTRTGYLVTGASYQFVSSLPAPFTRAVAKLNTKGVRMHDSMPVPDYPDVGL